MWLYQIVIDGPGIELHLLGQAVGNDAHDIFFVFGGTFPIVLIAFQAYQFIGFPLGERERPGSYWMSAKVAVSQGKSVGVAPSFLGFG